MNNTPLSSQAIALLVKENGRLKDRLVADQEKYGALVKWAHEMRLMRGAYKPTLGDAMWHLFDVLDALQSEELPNPIHSCADSIRLLREDFNRAMKDVTESDEGEQRSNAWKRLNILRDQLIEIRSALGEF